MRSVFQSVSFLAIFTLVSFGSSRYVFAALVPSIEAKGLAFISEDYEKTNASQFGFFGASLRSVHADEDQIKVNLSGAYAIGTPVLSYMNVREIYFTYSIDETSQIHIGRKLNTWSELDSRWNLGFFQPQFRWNSLDPENQGLTGLFWDKKFATWKFLIFGSPIFIPDQGPGYELKDGKFQASNPWFQAPPQRLKFQDLILPIDYEVKTPEMSEVLFQPNFGAQVHIGNGPGFFGQFSGLYKPSHQVAIGYKGVSVLLDRVEVQVLPKTYYENLAAADFGYREEWGTLGLSALHTSPKNPEYDESYNYPVLNSSTSWGPRVRFVTDHFELEALGLWTEGGEVTEVGPDTSSTRAPLTMKYLYKKAYQLQATYRNTFSDKVRLTSTIQWRESERSELKQLRFKNTMDLRGPWKFIADLILVETNDEVTSVSNYRNLDQAWIGAGYEF